MPELIKKGHIYISMPPLYKITRNKKSKYILTEKDLQSEIKGKRNYTIQRFKGLGEMNPEQLWETTMNPETRTLKKVCIEDKKDAEETLVMLMGSKVPPRRAFIEEESKRRKANQ